MLTREENERITRVGPGTPGGAMLRRYWWPVAFSAELTDRPMAVRLLGEDLVLFRAGDGLGLLDRYCAHRQASLEYGRVEGDCIRCCYHGWLYAPDGRCVEQPAEPPTSTYHERVHQTAYQAQELGGLVFAYLGPTPAPLLPRYDVLCRDDGTRILQGRGGLCNWLQSVENAIDMTHLSWLHASVYPDFAGRRCSCEWERTAYGFRGTLHVAGLPEPKVSYTIFPAHNRFAQARVGTEPSQRMLFRVPVDDTNTNHYMVVFEPHPRDATDRPFALKTEGLRGVEPGKYDRTEDAWWGIGSQDQDRVVQESQGAIVDRSLEHLGSSDRGIIMLREALLGAINAVECGEDPFGVIRDPAQNKVVEFDAQFHMMEALVPLAR
jgi:5,5'-dehydrodivanillate O-demethylase oxygenase subunit